jgi:hypothetical protein
MRANERPQNKFHFEGTRIYMDIATLLLTQPRGPSQSERKIPVVTEVKTKIF